MKHFRLLAWITALLLLLSACSSNAALSGASSENESAAGIAITDFNDRSISFSEPPERIVALSIGEADIIYALGSELVGRPASNVELRWEAAKSVREVGTTHEADLEQIAFVKPQAVLAHNVMNASDVTMLESLGAKVILTSGNSIADIERQITIFGTMLQKEERAEQLIAAIEAKLTELSQKASAASAAPALLVYGAPGTFMAALPNSLSGNILELAGGTNIASSFPALQNYPQYAQLNAERIVEANPQHIFIMTHGDPESVKGSFLKEMESSPAWNSIDAVINGNISILPAELFGSNPGTRIVESLDMMHELLQAK